MPKDKRKVRASHPKESMTSHLPLLQVRLHLRPNRHGHPSPQSTRCPLSSLQPNFNHRQDLSIGNRLKWAMVLVLGSHPVDFHLVAPRSRKRLQPTISIDHGKKCRQGRLENSSTRGQAVTNLFRRPEEGLGEMSKPHAVRHFYKDRFQANKRGLQSLRQHSKPIGLLLRRVRRGRAAVHHRMSVEEVGGLRVGCRLDAPI